MDKIVQELWFKDGISFKCTGCGKCCTGSDGYVFLSDSDIHRLSERLSLKTDEFIEKYTRKVDDDRVLLDTENSDCIFLKNNQCSVYVDRPVQCRTYPWWIDNIRSEKAWKEAALHCEGIDHKDAVLVPAIEIEAQCGSYLDNLLETNFL